MSKPKTKLWAIRQSKGLKRKELSELSDVPYNTILSYEFKTRKISRARLQTLCSLASALGCRIDDILDGEEVKNNE